MEKNETAKWDNVHGKQNRQFKSHVRTSSIGEINCYFCNESEKHVTKNERKGTNIIRYFAYKMFTEMAPLPGAKQEGIIHSGFVKWCHAKFRKA